MINGIVLAAGTSSRLGRPKQLLDLGGRSVLRWVLDAALPDYLQGQSTSIRAGLRALDEGSQAAVVLLADQPGIRADAIDSVIAGWRKGAGPIVQASYDGKPAHPTLLSRELWPELEALTGDEGARSFIAAHARRRSLVEVGGEPPDDIDTEADYRLAVARQQSNGNG